MVFVFMLGCKATILRWEPQALLGMRCVQMPGRGTRCRALYKNISWAPMYLPGLASTQRGGCCSGVLRPHKRKEGKIKWMNYMDMHAVGWMDFSMCPLCVKPFLVCHNIMCGRDEFLNHVLLSQKLGHTLLSYFNIITYFFIQ